MSTNLAKGLIVGGYPIFCRGIRAILEEELRWKVCGQAPEGRRARELCTQLQPDFVVFDVDLPEENGWDCLEDCMRLLPRARFLVLSEKEGQRWLQRAFYAGAHAYLSKRDIDRELVTGLQGILGKKGRFLGPRLNGALMEEWARSRAPAAGSEVDALSDRERDVLSLAGEGLGVTAIAKRLSLSGKTVETYQARLKHKLGLATTKALRDYAARCLFSAKTFLAVAFFRVPLALDELAAVGWPG